MREFKHRIREVRKSKDLSGISLAKMLGISPQHYYDIERGKRTLSAELAVRLADYFSVSLDYLLCRTDDPSFRIADAPVTRDVRLSSLEEKAAVRAFVEVYRRLHI